MENQSVTKDDLRVESVALEDRLIERMHSMETNLLKAFYGFEESVQQRLAQHDFI